MESLRGNMCDLDSSKSVFSYGIGSIKKPVDFPENFEVGLVPSDKDVL